MRVLGRATQRHDTGQGWRGSRGVSWGLGLLGLILAIAGYFEPWVPHGTSALVVTGFELVEFVKFFPQVQGGAVPVIREMFLAPLLAAAILTGLMGYKWPIRPRGQAALVGLSALLALFALPPYEYLFAPPYRLQLVLAICAVVLVLLTPATRYLPRRVFGGLFALIALAGIGLALWQFALLHPLVVDLYGQSLGVGWGMVTCTMGFVLLLMRGMLAAAFAGKA